MLCKVSFCLRREQDAMPTVNSDVSKDSRFIESIINGMYDWVRVLDRNDNILYINDAMSQALGNPPLGEKCYKLLGRSAPCEACISRMTVFHGHPHEKEEIINEKIYSVMSSPIKNEAGEVTAVVEVLRDVTLMKQLQKQLLLQNKRLQEDLDMAKKLQCSLLPKNLPEDKLNFSFLYKPCESLGGDFLDIFPIDKDHVGVYIADVSGHGVSASMLTVFLRSAINKRTLSPAKALSELYKEFNSSSFDQDFYITVFYAIIDTEDKEIIYSNAGHNVSPIIFNTDRFELLRVPGIPISNWLKEPSYQNRRLKFSTGDRLFLYTDGIVEIKNERDEQYGEERLLNILLNDPGTPNGILNRIMDNACEFAGINDVVTIPDDITIGLLEMK